MITVCRVYRAWSLHIPTIIAHDRDAPLSRMRLRIHSLFTPSFSTASSCVQRHVEAGHQKEIGPTLASPSCPGCLYVPRWRILCIFFHCFSYVVNMFLAYVRRKKSWATTLLKLLGSRLPRDYYLSVSCDHLDNVALMDDIALFINCFVTHIV